MKIGLQVRQMKVLEGMKIFLADCDDVILIAERGKGSTRKPGLELTAVYEYLKRFGFSAFCGPTVSLTYKNEFTVEGKELTMKNVFTSSCNEITYWKKSED